MFITRKSLPRRTMLRGMGAALALPLLDAMVPALSAVSKTAARPVRRAGFVYIPNGAVIDEAAHGVDAWSPIGEGSSFELSPILAPWRRCATGSSCSPGSITRWRGRWATGPATMPGARRRG